MNEVNTPILAHTPEWRTIDAHLGRKPHAAARVEELEGKESPEREGLEKGANQRHMFLSDAPLAVLGEKNETEQQVRFVETIQRFLKALQNQRVVGGGAHDPRVRQQGFVWR